MGLNGQEEKDTWDSDRQKKGGEDFPNTGDGAGKIIKAGMLTGQGVSTGVSLKQREVVESGKVKLEIKPWMVLSAG